MQAILEDFPSVKLLLCILCVILFIGFSLTIDAVRLLTGRLDSLRKSLPGDIAEGLEAGNTNLERQRDSDFESRYLKEESSMLQRDIAADAVAPKPFQFTISTEAAALIEKIKPGSSKDWALLTPSTTDTPQTVTALDDAISK